MYATIKGIITSIEPTHLVLENQGIGFLIYTPNPYASPLFSEVTMFVHHYVKEDINALYGFKEIEYKHMFLKLINVSGIGPKTALSILATDDIKGLIQSIELADINYLKKFPGIGPKSAQQIILDLKGKLTFTQEQQQPKLIDVEQALIALGYKKSEISKMVQSLDPSLSTENMIKEALKKLLR
jgi:holliday junction DNA helicase RuvA